MLETLLLTNLTVPIDSSQFPLILNVGVGRLTSSAHTDILISDTTSTGGVKRTLSRKLVMLWEI